MWNWIKAKIKWILLGGAVVAGTLGVEQQITDNIILNTPLTEVPLEYEIESVANYSFFKKGKEVIEIEITDDEYLKIAKEGYQPTYKDYVWVQSVGGDTVYSEKTVGLQDYQYMILATSTIVENNETLGGFSGRPDLSENVKIKLPGRQEQYIKTQDIVNGKISQEALQKMSKGKVSFLRAKTAYGAIAYDNSAKQNYSGLPSSFTFPYTVGSNDNRILFVQIYWQSDRTVTAISYNGSAMTAVAELLTLAYGEQHGLYYIVAPSTGNNNISVTFSGTTAYHAIAVSYDGVVQTSPIDVSRTETDTTTTQNYSEAITTTTDNAWAIWATRDYSGRVPTAGANTAVRQSEQINYGTVVADSGQAIATAGSYTMTLVSTGGNGNWYTDIIAAFKPATEATSSPIIYDNSLIWFE